MKTRVLPAALICSLVLSPIFAEDSSPSELDDWMEQMNTAYRKLTRQIADPAKNVDSLKQIATIRDRATEAAKLEPKKKADIPAAEQAKFVADYQAKMKTFLADIDKLEAAVKAGKNEEAAALVKTLKQAQEDGHKQFKRGKEKKKAG